MNIEERIKVARLQLILKRPFYGFLLARMPIIAIDDPALRTIATDGRKIYYCAEFIDSLTNDELVFAFGHEVLHNILDHFVRREERNPEYWNMATDYAINAWLKADKVGSMPKCGLFKANYSGMSAEVIYSHLVKQNAKIKESLDLHIIGDGNMPGSSGGIGGEPLSAREINELRNAIINAKQINDQSNGAGSLPDGLERVIGNILESKISWQQYLEKIFSESVRANYSYARYNKRNYGLDVILPGKANGEKINVHIAIDASGSVDDEMLRKFLGEVKGIVDQYNDCEITIWCFDGGIHNVQQYDRYNLDDITSYKIAGNGGTLFDINWDFMKDPTTVEQDIINEPFVPNNFILFTDGYPCGSWGDEHYCNTIFAICGDRYDSPAAPFGKTIYIE